MKDAISVYIDKEHKLIKTILVGHIETLFQTQTGDWTIITLTSKEQISAHHSKDYILSMMDAKV